MYPPPPKKNNFRPHEIWLAVAFPGAAFFFDFVFSFHFLSDISPFHFFLDLQMLLFRPDF